MGDFISTKIRGTGIKFGIQFNLCMDKLNYWKVRVFPKVLIPLRKERKEYMEDCAENVQELLLNMIYGTRETTERSVNLNLDGHVEMTGVLDEDVLEDVYNGRDGLYGRMNYFLQPILVGTNFRVTRNEHG